MIESTVRGVGRARPLVVVLLALLVVPVATRAEAQQERTVSTRAEAWYRPALVGGEDDPACALTGCPTTVTVPANPYPEDTLHVGASSGRAESTTHLVLDVDLDDVALSGGTLLLPVAPSEDGTVAPDLAELLVCLATGDVEPVEGGDAADAPGTDCNVATAARFVPAEDDEQAHFEVDLARFLESWSDQGVAALGLVPDPAGTATWHVAMSGRDREGEDVSPPVTAVLEVATPVAAPGPRPSPSPSPSPAAVPAPAPSPSSSPAPAAPPARAPAASAPFVRGPSLSTSTTTVPAAAEAPVVAAPPAVATPAPTPTVVAAAPVATVRLPYAHREVWLAPLGLLLLGALLLRTLQADVQVVTDDRPRR